VSVTGWLGQLNAAWEVLRDLLLGRYPPFVTGGALPKGHVPVFVFHSVEPRSFDHKLEYLQDNNYVTFSVTEYFDVVTGAREAPERAVLLTFDDGRASVFSEGFPLLSRRGMKATLFLVPARLRKADESAVTAGPNEGFMSWDEVRLLARSGLFDLESHSLTHARVHTEPILEGFVTPGVGSGYTAMDVPLIHDQGADQLAGEVPLGTPLLRAQPRTSEALRFYEDLAARKACVEEVRQGGGAEFFKAPGWRQRLRQIAGQTPTKGRLETAAEREDAIRQELKESKHQIEERTNRPVTHLCYPWHVSGPTARRLAVEVGYRTAFCGKVEGVPLTAVGGDPRAIARIGEDYLELLPGRGRGDLMNVLRRKWLRRFTRPAI
jgi:peptidoglycan/xylan/chitin deacetylase (PgdA/CDA1 family)